MAKAGFTVHQLDNYIKTGELLAVVPGVYTSPNTTLNWEGVVASLERLDFDITVGALTSLELSGHGHYLAMSQKQGLYLYTSSRVPTWLKKVLPDTNVVTRTRTKLLNPDKGTDTFFERVSSHDFPAIELKASKPELAILEFLQGVPKQASFEHADLLMEGLTTLSPKRLNNVLNSCNNVRVKRLFFWLAHRHNHAWLKAIDYKKYDLGNGKRAVALQGILDKKFQITVPKDMHAASE